MGLRGPRPNPQVETPEPVSRPAGKSRGRHPAALILTFIVMMALWMLLSGRFDAFHLGMGVISAAGVAWFSSGLLFDPPPRRDIFGSWLRFLAYIPWLLYQILKANLDVLKIVLHPRMHRLIDPHIVKFKSDLSGDLALVTLANSITLTPGTITVFVTIDGDYSVHALTRQAGDVSALKDMERKVAQAFNQV